MKKRIRSIILRVGTVICSLAIFAEVFSVERCKGIWYQPKEPDGYGDFLKKKK